MLFSWAVLQPLPESGLAEATLFFLNSIWSCMHRWVNPSVFTDIRTRSTGCLRDDQWMEAAWRPGDELLLCTGATKPVVLAVLYVYTQITQSSDAGAERGTWQLRNYSYSYARVIYSTCRTPESGGRCFSVINPQLGAMGGVVCPSRVLTQRQLPGWSCQ